MSRVFRVRLWLRPFLVLMIVFACGGDLSTTLHAEEHAKPKGESGSESSKSKEKPKDNKKQKEDDENAKNRFGENVYVHLDPMVMPIISDNGAEQIVTMLIDIQVKNYDAADAIHGNMPRVRDAIVSSLYGGLGEGSLRDGQMVNVNRIKAKITDALEKALGSGKIEAVLVQAIAQRKL